MKNLWFCVLCICTMLTLNGCGNENVDNVLDKQTGKEDSMVVSEAQDKENVQTDATVENTKGIDYDLSVMDEDMLYATIYQMMSDPDTYIGKRVKMTGKFTAGYDEKTKKTYFYSTVLDGTECCSMSMEFVWEDGSHVYPKEYPEENANITITGVFETYQDDGDENLYCRLKNAQLEVNES